MLSIALCSISECQCSVRVQVSSVRETGNKEPEQEWGVTCISSIMKYTRISQEN